MLSHAVRCKLLQNFLPVYHFCRPDSEHWNLHVVLLQSAYTYVTSLANSRVIRFVFSTSLHVRCEILLGRWLSAGLLLFEGVAPAILI
jgi:hypothetical protein